METEKNKGNKEKGREKKTGKLSKQQKEKKRFS
jgi:hypothetical protein